MPLNNVINNQAQVNYGEEAGGTRGEGPHFSFPPAASSLTPLPSPSVLPVVTECGNTKCGVSSTVRKIFIVD